MNEEDLIVKYTYKIHEDIQLLLLYSNFWIQFIVIWVMTRTYRDYEWDLLPKGCSQKDLVVEDGFHLQQPYKSFLFWWWIDGCHMYEIEIILAFLIFK